jgi:hypothetical protein
LQNEHHKWKSERGAGEGVGADATKEEAVEDDDANERENSVRSVLRAAVSAGRPV